MIYHIFIFVVNITPMLLAHGNKFKSVNSKSVSSIQKIKTQQNQICTFNVKEHDFLIVTFSADNASKSSCYICTINNKGSLLIVIDKNQVDDGYKIESISCDKFVLTIKTSVFGGSLKVITI